MTSFKIQLFFEKLPSPYCTSFDHYFIVTNHLLYNFFFSTGEAKATISTEKSEKLPQRHALLREGRLF